MLLTGLPKILTLEKSIIWQKIGNKKIGKTGNLKSSEKKSGILKKKSTKKLVKPIVLKCLYI